MNKSSRKHKPNSFPAQYVGRLQSENHKKLTEDVLAPNVDEIIINLSVCQNKQEVLQSIGNALEFPTYYGANLDALYDCLTDYLERPGKREDGIRIFLQQLSDLNWLDEEQRESLLDVFRDAAEFYTKQRWFFQVFWS